MCTFAISGKTKLNCFCKQFYLDEAGFRDAQEVDCD